MYANPSVIPPIPVYTPCHTSECKLSSIHSRVLTCVHCTTQPHGTVNTTVYYGAIGGTFPSSTVMTYNSSSLGFILYHKNIVYRF